VAPYEDDRALVDACVAGEKRAWDEFVGRFSKLVWWSVGKAFAGTPYASRRDVHEDVFQETFARLLERGELGTLREATSVRKFLAVSACRRALDRAKSLSRAERRTSAGEDAESPILDTISDGAPDPAEAASGTERRRLVAETLQGLPSRERLCIEMHYGEGLTHREISEALGIPQDTVSTVIRRTRVKLKSLLEEKGLDGPE